MTNVREGPVRCAICDRVSTAMVVETYSLRGRYMDTRPLFLGADMIPYMIQRCPRCGYSAPDISSTEGVDINVVTTDWLKRLPIVGRTAVAYQTRAAIDEVSGDLDNAGRAYLAAAWVFDSNRGTRKGMTMRRRAADCFRDTENPEYMLIRADILRSLGEFEEADRQLDVLHDSLRGCELDNIAAFERMLIRDRETSFEIMMSGIDIENPRTLHHMRLMSGEFQKLCDGRMFYEVRLHDPKRSRVKVDDVIEFTDMRSSETVRAKVTEIRSYDSFEDVFSDIDPVSMGYGPGEVAGPRDMDRFYTREDQDRYGLLAFRLELPPRHMSTGDVYGMRADPRDPTV